MLKTDIGDKSQIDCTVELAKPTLLTIPKRKPGAQSARAKEVYEAEVEAFCAAIIEIRSNLDFAVSSRGLCYILESRGLAKGDFDTGQNSLMNAGKPDAFPSTYVQKIHVDPRRTSRPSIKRSQKTRPRP